MTPRKERLTNKRVKLSRSEWQKTGKAEQNRAKPSQEKRRLVRKMAQISYALLRREARLVRKEKKKNGARVTKEKEKNVLREKRGDLRS